MRIQKLDGLRGFLSLMIVFHNYDETKLPYFIGENFIIKQSWVLVDFFFMLSGFVIYLNYQNISNYIQLKGFLVKRFVRLYPLILYTTLIFLALTLIPNFFLKEVINNPESVTSMLYRTIDTLLLTNSLPLFGVGHGLSINGPSWSLSAETVSYLIFGISMLFFKKISQKLLIFFLIISSLLFSLLINTELDFSFLRCIISFNLGILLFELNKIKYSVPDYFELIIPIIIIIPLFMISNSSGLTSTLHGVITANLAFFISLIILLKTKGVITKFMEKKFMQYLGKISYSVYLNHFIICILMSKISFTILKVEVSLLNQMIVFTSTVFAVLIYSNFTYNFIEIKTGNLLKKNFNKFY